MEVANRFNFVTFPADSFRVRIGSGGNQALSSMKKRVICRSFANHEIGVRVIAPDFIEMVDFDAFWKRTSKGSFCYKNMLKYIAINVCAWMLRHSDKHVSQIVNSALDTDALSGARQ